MTHSWIMRLLAVVSLVFGVALLFAPNALLAMYQAPPLTSPGIYNSMLYGGALIGFAVMNWTASSDSVAEAKHVILGTFVATSIGLLVALYRQLTDPNVTQAAWLNVLIFITLAILYGYLQFAQPGSPASTARRSM